MPIYMDRDDVSDTVTAENVAQLHHEDLKIQHKFNCKGITYWFDENRKTAFCLVKAPNEQVVFDMYNHAHGEVPHRIIEVNEKIVESFLGRIEDSQKSHNSVAKTVKKFNGRILNKDNNRSLVSFKSVRNAVLGALKIQFKYVTPKFDLTNRILKIALSSGISVIEKDIILEEVITLVTRMCEFVKGQFLTKLMYFMDNNWNNPNFNVANFSKKLGYSKSQLYRKLVKLIGKSANNFLRKFRLHRAVNLLYKQKGNISEIAYETGFNSPAYFSKCFLDKYGILPLKYMQQHNN